jgi:predicted kinase
LGKELALPILSKDAIKEALYDAMGAPTPERSQELGRGAYAVLYAVASALLTARVGLVLEGNFARGRSEAGLRPLTAKASAVLVHCQAPVEEIVRRYRERAMAGGRHAGHHDAAALARLLTELETGAYEPVELDLATLRVDTSSNYMPGMDVITAFARSAPAVKRSTIRDRSQP